MERLLTERNERITCIDCGINMSCHADNEIRKHQENTKHVMVIQSFSTNEVSN